MTCIRRAFASPVAHIVLCFLSTLLVFTLAVGLTPAVIADAREQRTASAGKTLTGPTPAMSGPWRSGGPYGGAVRALGLSPAFNTDGFALAGGWQQGAYGITGGFGIARTNDGGASWQLLQDTEHRWPVFDLAISAAFATDRTAFAGTDVGLLRSTDQGDTWTRLYGGLPTGVHGEPELDDIAHIRISPAFAADGTLYAVPRSLPGGQASLYRSTDRGDVWTRVYTGTVAAVALSRHFDTDDTLFIAVRQTGTTRILRSTDRGGTWAEVFDAGAAPVVDLLGLHDATVLLATDQGIVRLVPQGDVYVADPVTENIATAVHRLALAGDHIYAAAEGGLYISLSEGRTWQRYADTPALPFHAVAPCPLWGICHALMAGGDTGLLFTPDDNLQPWRWLPGLYPLRTESVVASPAYDGDGTLFAGTAEGVFRSADRGVTWQRLPTGDPPGHDAVFRAVRLSPAYATDGTVFASYEDRTLAQTALYRSSDRGQTWTVFPAVAGGTALAVSPVFPVDRTVFFGRGDRIFKSTDAGATWTSYPVADIDPITEIAVSPGYAADRTVYLTGYGGVRRSLDGGVTWASMPTSAPAYDLAISPAYATDGTVWHTFRAIEAPGDDRPESAVVRTTNWGGTWSMATAGLPGVYEPFPYPVAVSPRYATDRTLFTALYGQFVAGTSHSLYRALDGGAWWNDLGPAPGNPNVLELAATGYGPQAVAAHLATDAGVWHYESLCEERLTNGGFEVKGAGWQLPATPATAVYSTKYAHTGQQSVRTGIDGGTNVYSYSSGNQYITIPAGSASAKLTVWWYPISGEGPLAAESAAVEGEPDARILAAAAASSLGLAPEEVAPDAIQSTDRQYILLLDGNGNVLKTLLWTRSNARTWQQLTFDLAAYRGVALRVAFGTYNDGKDGATAMYIDDAALTICWPAPAEPTVTPTPTATRGPRVPRAFLPLMLHSYPVPTPTATPTATYTPTATRTPTPSLTPPPGPTVTPGACYAGLANGGFETDSAWIIRSNPVLAGYVTSPVHSGLRSMRTGIPAGGSNVTSYSPIEQAATFPATLASARLRFWRYNIYGDGTAAVSEAAAIDAHLLPTHEADLPDAVFAVDFFYVIGIRPDGAIEWLLTESLTNATWRERTIDVSRFRGQTIRFQFGTYNNGTGGISRTFVDDVSLELCPPAGALVLPHGWAQRVIGRSESGTLYADVSGRLYRSDDAGGTWRVTGTARPEHTLLGALPEVLYAGDGRSCYVDGPATDVWRTLNSGASWLALPAAADLKPLAAHASQPWLYLGGCGGPSLSMNGGATVLFQPDPLFSLYDVKQLAPAGADWRTVWAGAVSEGGGGAVLVSRDGGETWTQSTPLYLDMGWMGALALNRHLPGGVFAAASRGFFQTTDDGATWQNVSVGLEDVVDPGTADRSYGLLAIAQSPVDSRVYLGTVRGLYVRPTSAAAWHKVTGVPFENLEVRGLLLLDAAPGRLYVTTPAGVFIYDTGSTPPTPTLTPTATATATPTRTPTPTVSTAVIPTAAPGVWPTPYALATLTLPAGSHPHGLLVNATDAHLYAAYHGANHDGRQLGILRINPLAAETTVELDTEAAGPNALALLPRPGTVAGYWVAVTNRETGELVFVDPVTRAVTTRRDVGDQPDGVAAVGDSLYVANYANDAVSRFDPVTLASLGEIGVGHEPSLFAVDPDTGDAYLSLHGADKVARLHGGSVAEEYLEIPEPYSLAFDATDRRLYVASRGHNHSVTVLDIAEGSRAGVIPVGGEALLVAVNPDTGHLFVVVAAGSGRQAEVYSTLDWQRIAVIPLPAGAEEGITVDSRTGRVYIACGESDTIAVLQDVAAAEVLFTSDRDGNTEVYRMLPDGRAQTRLTFTPGLSETDAAGSPDGRWIAYTVTSGGGRELWRMSRNGRNAHRLASGGPDDYNPAWSPGGEYLAFVSTRSGQPHIYRLDLATGAVTPLNVAAGSAQGPDWSWATGRIAFEYSATGGNTVLYTMAADGSAVQQLLANPNSDAQPNWSPDGARLVFWGTRSEQTLYRVNADGSGVVPLVSRALRPAAPHWGPAGADWIVFTGYRPGSGYSEVFRMTPDGAGLVLLTQNEVNFDNVTGWLPGTRP